MEPTTITEVGLGGRAGRKRKAGRRHPSGELVRESRFPDDKVRAGRQPHRRRLDDADRLSDRAESPFGQLSLLADPTRSGRKVIDEHQYQAGEHYAILVGQYRSVIEGPRSTAGSGQGRGCEGGCALMIELFGADKVSCHCLEAKLRYECAFEALTRVGRRELMAVNRVAVHREAIASQDLVYLKAGLDGLAKHFGLGVRRSREYSGNAH
jgi:hypothetical protein